MAKLAIAFQKLSRLVDNVFLYIGLMLLTVIIVASSLQVFTRYALNASMVGTEELARFCFIWMNMLGASICISKGSHASVTMITERFKGNLKKVHSIFVYVLVLTASLILIVQGLKMVEMVGAQISPTLHVPMSIIYLAVPIGGIGMVINSCVDILKALSGINKEVVK